MTPKEEKILRDLLKESVKASPYFHSSSSRLAQKKDSLPLSSEPFSEPVHSFQRSMLLKKEKLPVKTRAMDIALRKKRRLSVVCRDRGICSLCGLNTIDLEDAIGHVRDWMEAYKPGWGEELDWTFSFFKFKKAVGFKAWRWPNRLWEIDHIIPRCHGGSDELSNLRTLCLPCHRAETNRLIHRKESA